MDWNSDGKKDLVIGIETGLIRVYINTGTDAAPAFNYETTGYINVKTGSTDYDCGERATPDVLDWDNDGDLDLICGEDVGVINLLINTAGPGTSPVFSGSSLIQRSGGNIDVGSSAHPVVFDWTGDGKKDLLIGEESGGKVRLFANSGTDASPVFTSYVELSAGGATLDAGTYSRPEVCDYDSDGVPDLLVGNYDGKVLYYRGLRPITVTVPAEATEGDGTLAAQGMVSIGSPAAADMIVTLGSTPAGEVGMPPTVTISTGNTNATFDVTITDDTDLDGSQAVAISATAYSYTEGSDVIVVHDNESTSLSLSLASTATEGDAPLTATVTLTGRPPEKDITVSLESSDASELAVPATATVTAGTISQTFPVTVVDDTVIDSTQSATISVHVENWTDDTADVAVHDNEHTNLMVALPDWTGEGDGLLANAGTIFLSGTVTSALEVSLESLDLTELTVPTSVTIPAGASSATFDLTILNDGAGDGQQTVTVSATAAGFAPGSDTVPVADSTVHHIEFGMMSSPHTVAVPFPVTVRMCDVTGANAAFTGSIDLSGTGDSGGATLTPVTTGPLTRGQWTGMVRVDTIDTNVRLKGELNRMTAWSEPFDVVPGNLDHFSFSPIASPQTATLPFGVTITARDANGYVAAGFDSAVALDVSTAAEIGTGTDSWNYPLSMYYHDARTQVIYPASDFSGAGTITALALDVTTLPGQVAENWTIRVKHTAMTSYATAAWEADGWTTAYQNDETFTTTGWTTFEFDTPFDYNGTDSLMIDFTFNNASYTRDGNCRYTAATETRSLYYRTDSGDGDPLTWSGTANPTPSTTTYVPNIRLQMGTVGMTPDTTDAFVDGVWSGDVTILDGCTNIKLRAAGGGAEGYSDPFSVTDNAIDVQCAVSGSADNAREVSGRHITTTGGDTLELGSPTFVVSAVRFAHVPIPAGAEVRSATVQFTAAAANSNAVALTVRGEKTPDAAPFANGVAYDITSRSQTTNSVAWTPAPWEQVDDAGAAQQPPDLTVVLQEIVSQPGWASNQAVSLVFHHGSSAGTRSAHAFDGDPAKAPVLHVSYRFTDLDQDNDGMPDAWEIEHFGTTTNSSGQACDDFDGDGMCDRGEFYSGTDPTSSNSVLALTCLRPMPGQDLVLRWASATGRIYAVDEANGLLGRFHPLTNGLPATPPENAHTVTVDQVEGPVFYRIRLE